MGQNKKSRQAVKHMRQKTEKLILAALFAALVFVGSLLSVPTPVVGNVNFGDGFVLLGTWMLGLPGGALAAGVGAALCDLVNGYALYAPATLLIKALMGTVGAVAFFGLGRCHLPRRACLLFSGVMAEAVMVAGYFAYEAVGLGYGFGAVAGLPFNALQGACGLVLAMVLDGTLDIWRKRKG